LVKQFVQSVKEITVGGYIGLEPESVNSGEQMEQEFLNRF